MKFASVLSLTLFTATLAAQGNNVLTYVGSSGIDQAFCGSRDNPCFGLQYAVNHTVDNGIVVFLDALNDAYSVTITRPVTIDGNGVGIRTTYGGGHVITVTNAGHVEIRNLAIHVDPPCVNCDGIHAVGTYMTIKNVAITGPANNGVYVAGGTHAVIQGLTVTGPFIGIYVTEQVATTITDSAIQYATYGIYVEGKTFPTSAMIERTRLTNNLTGLWVQNSGTQATARISDCVIYGNSAGVQTVAGGQIITFRNNTWAGNTTDGTTPLSASLK